MNTTETNIEIPEVIFKLTQNVLCNREFIIKDWDLDRIYLDVDRTNDDYTIRMWNITENSISWTLFKTIWNDDGGGHGGEESEGTFNYKI